MNYQIFHLAPHSAVHLNKLNSRQLYNFPCLEIAEVVSQYLQVCVTVTMPASSGVVIFSEPSFFICISSTSFMEKSDCLN